LAATDLTSAPLTRIARLLQSRQASPIDLVDAYLERITAGRDLKAFITVSAESARRQARLAERRLLAGDARPLLGVPLAIKDLFATAGVRTTVGSRILRSWVPRTDAAVVSRLRGAGALILGKTNLHEFAYGVTNANPWWGTARNPVDPARIPGGSSGGSAIAVVAGMSAAALGSDTGGSIRIPAALCGCVGLKPTYGSVPVEGAFPLGWTLDHAGPLTRTVDDAELLLEVLTSRTRTRRPALRELRLGVLQGPTFRLVQPAVASAVEAAVAELRRAGMRTRRLEIPELAWAETVQLITLRAEAAAVHAEWLRRRPRSYGEDVRTRLQLGALIPASDYVLAQRARVRLREALRRAFDQVDVLAMPTTAIVAPPVGDRRVRWGSKEEAVDAALVRLTLPFNLTGLPALSVPCPVDSRLPVGLQLVAPWGEESRLFAAGRALEA